MKLLSINVGLPRTVSYGGRAVSTGIWKFPVPTGQRVRVGRLNLEGDGQADLTVHGGVDKAVYAYSADAFAWWEKELGRKLETAELGENLTFDRLEETKAYVGNVYRLGTCELQVAQPRFPCFKLGIRMGDDGVLKTFVRSHRPGVYFRVVKEGEIAVGDQLTLTSEDPQKVPLIAMWDMKMRPSNLSLDLVRRLGAVESLLPDWRAKIERLLQRGS